MEEPVLTSPKRPAAYVRHATAPARQEMALAARQRSWPAPVIYAEGDPASADGYSPALDRLTAAIISGRHDAVLMTAPGTLGDPGPLSRLLSRCTRHGVIVSFIPPPVPPNQAMTEPAVHSFSPCGCCGGPASTQTKVKW